MAPFEYRPFEDRFVGTIGDLIRRGPDAYARAAEIGGSAWANAAHDIGGTLGALGQQIPQAQRQAVVDQGNQLKLDEAQHAVAGQRELASVLQGDQLPAGDAGPRMPSFLKDEGGVSVFDVDGISKFMASRGYGDLIPQYVKDVSAVNDAHREAAKAQQAMALMTQSLVAKHAGLALQMIRDGVDPQTAVGFQFLQLKANQTVPDQQLQAYQDAFAKNPDQIPAILTAMARAGGGAPIKLGKDEQLLNPNDPAGPPLASNMDPDEGGYTINGQRFDKHHQPVGPLVPPQTPPKSLAPEKFRLDGKDVQGNFDPASGKYFYNGEDVTGRAVPIPSAAITIHNDPVAAAGRSDNARQIVDGNMPPSFLSKRSTDYNATLAEANKISKEETGKPINLAKMQLDYEAAKKWVATQNSDRMVRYRGLAESVVNTIDEVRDLANELRQGDVQKFNSLKRSTVQQVYGNTPESELAVRYVAAVNTLKEEFANLANGGFAPTDAAWTLANEQINKDFGFKDMTASLVEVQRLINFRTHAFANQRPVGLDGVVPPPNGGGPVNPFRKPGQQ